MIWNFKFSSIETQHIWIDGSPLETQQYIFKNNIEKVLLHLDQYWRKKTLQNWWIPNMKLTEAATGKG